MRQAGLLKETLVRCSKNSDQDN